MVSNPTKGPIYNLFWLIGHSPRKILEFLQFVALGWVLAQTLFGFGGFLPYGEPMIGVSKSLLLLAGLHALVMVFRPERPSLEWELIFPVPFLLYACLHYSFISPTSWEAGSYLTVLVQAYVIFFVVFNTIRSGRSARWMLYVAQIVMGIALFAAVFEFYLFPKWMPVMDRIRNPLYSMGAAGFLQDPANLGAILISFFPLSLLLATKYYRTSPVWIWQAFLAFFIIIGFVLCSYPMGLLILALILIAYPLMVTGFWDKRLRFWRNILIFLPFLLFMIWFGTDELHTRLTWFLSLPADELAATSRSVAWAQFLAKPVFGQGLGSFAANWETFVPAGVTGTSRYAGSAFASILAETGFVGLLLAGLPVVFLLARGFRAWGGIPYLHLHPDVINRLSGLSANHPLRRRAKRHGGRMSSQKTILGSLLLGLVGLFLYVAFDYAFQLPVTLFLFACLAACLAAYTRRLTRSSEKRKLWLVTALLPLVLSGWAVSFGLPQFYTSHLVFTANEEMDRLLSDPDLIFSDPGSLSAVEGSFKIATDLDSSNGEAWTGLGSARLAQLYASLISGEEIGAMALPAFEKALESGAGLWIAHYNLARTLALLNRDMDQIKLHLQAAMALAPNRPEPVAFMGGLQLLGEGSFDAGVVDLKRALELNPAYEPALKALERIGNRATQNQTGAPSFITGAYLAEQFQVLVGQENRVRGAGLPEPVDTGLQLPSASGMQ